MDFVIFNHHTPGDALVLVQDTDNHRAAYLVVDGDSLGWIQVPYPPLSELPNSVEAPFIGKFRDVAYRLGLGIKYTSLNAIAYALLFEDAKRVPEMAEQY